jgi:ferrochelatase
MKRRTAILLVNLGSPDSPAPADVRVYLTEFLNDPRVIDIPWLWRKLLVNAIIIPFRYRKSAKAYEKLWTPDGSPLVHYGRKTRDLLQERFNPEETKVFLAMRYRNPSMQDALREIGEWGPEEVVVLPLFPQYASASSGSVIQRFFDLTRKSQGFPHIRIISQFHDHPGYIRAIAKQARSFDFGEYDHILFSYHGLPERQLDALYMDRKCANHNCETEINTENAFCYKATCYDTTRRVVSELGISADQYTVCFQSRLGKGWVTPFTDDVIKARAAAGDKKLLVFSLSFVADCLETTIEIGEEYQELFEEMGGEKVQLVPAVNDDPLWIDALYDLVIS